MTKGKLESCIFIGPNPELPPRDWLSGLVRARGSRRPDPRRAAGRSSAARAAATVAARYAPVLVSARRRYAKPSSPAARTPPTSASASRPARTAVPACRSSRPCWCSTSALGGEPAHLLEIKRSLGDDRRTQGATRDRRKGYRPCRYTASEPLRGKPGVIPCEIARTKAETMPTMMAESKALKRVGAKRAGIRISFSCKFG